MSDSISFLDDDTVPLCWAASSQHTDGYANMGDSLSAAIVAGLADRAVCHTHFDAPTSKLVAVGSIGHAITHGLAVMWGSGVSARGPHLALNVPRTRYDVRAVRGPISAKHLRDHGVSAPSIYGDPVWFLPSMLPDPVERKYELGVIPHIQDIAGHHPAAPPRPESLRCIVDEPDTHIAVFNTWHEPTWGGLVEKVNLLRSCKRILSQSFHGVVIAEAYGIPSMNFRYVPGRKNGVLRIDLLRDCSTDPRIWEFYKGGRCNHFHMYNQRRNERTDWEAVIRAIDETWEPFDYDAEPLLSAFPLPLAYDPLSNAIQRREKLTNLQF